MALTVKNVVYKQEFIDISKISHQYATRLPSTVKNHLQLEKGSAIGFFEDKITKNIFLSKGEENLENAILIGSTKLSKTGNITIIESVRKKLAVGQGDKLAYVKESKDNRVILKNSKKLLE